MTLLSLTTYCRHAVRSINTSELKAEVLPFQQRAISADIDLWLPVILIAKIQMEVVKTGHLKWTSEMELALVKQVFARAAFSADQIMICYILGT